MDQLNIARFMMAMAIFTVLGLAFVAAAAWGMERQAAAYRSEARV